MYPFACGDCAYPHCLDALGGYCATNGTAAAAAALGAVLTRVYADDVGILFLHLRTPVSHGVHRAPCLIYSFSSYLFGHLLYRSISGEPHFFTWR
jgi:hypothetical protein